MRELALRPRIRRRPGSKLARIEEALLKEIAALRGVSDDGRARTSGRFLVYRLIAHGVIEKTQTDKTGGRRADQDVSVVLSDLRWSDVVGFDEIVDRSRGISDFRGYATFAEGAVVQLGLVRLDPWGAERAPLLIVESESLAGLVDGIAYKYRVPLVPSRGQCSDSLVYDVARLVKAGHRRVLYVGDFDLSGGHIEESFRARVEALAGVELVMGRDWRRLALTQAQVDQHHLPVIQKYDKRHKRHFPAVETEALDQAILLPLIEGTLAAWLPVQELDQAREAEERQRDRFIDAITGGEA